MGNTSDTGGYLAPAAAPAPLEGRALLRFLQGVISGVSGLPGPAVRPYWQDEPPDVPDAGVAWCAFKVTRRPSDEFPFVGRTSPDDGSDHLQRHEELEVLSSFYDTGSTGLNDSGGAADTYASLLRDGLMIAQNREPLLAAGMGLVRTGELVSAPVLFKLRWQNRVDFDFAVRRQVDRAYPVLTILSAAGTVVTDVGTPPYSASFGPVT